MMAIAPPTMRRTIIAMRIQSHQRVGFFSGVSDFFFEGRSPLGFTVDGFAG
jgi:hypothetical protein